MSWAYNPLLPVRTGPEARGQVAEQLDRPLNEFVTLVGYNQQLEPDSQMLRLDLLWQATAVSPVDYLTEVSLLDGQGESQAQWLGYPANGRYPTRAWDVGDLVRDTVWLPVAGLAAGPYQLQLNLVSTRRTVLPWQPASPPASPFTLTEITLQDPPLRRFNGGLPFTGQAMAAAGYSVWQNGAALTGPQPFRYRETVLVTLSPLLPSQQRAVRLIGPGPATPVGEQRSTDKQQIFAPVRELNDAVLFIVGPDWPSGTYRLQVTVTGPGETTSSDEQQVNSGSILRVLDLWERQFVEPPISHRVEANFADQVKLVGYDLGANRAEPGGGIPITLYWQGLDWLGSDYTIFTKLLAADQTVHGGRDRLPREGYRTLYWAPGEIIADPFGVPVDETAPAGIYYLNVGLYQQIGQQALSLPLVQAGELVEATSVNIGPIKIGDAPPGLVRSTAEPQTPVNQPFGEEPKLTLLGYDLAQPAEDGCQGAGGRCQVSSVKCQVSGVRCQVALTLYWRAEAVLPVDYTTFVHVRNAAGETVAQQDQPPLDGAYPTSLWDPGEIIADTIEVPLPADLPAGEYHLVVGLYDFNTGVRLTVPGSPDNSLTLSPVQINH